MSQVFPDSEAVMVDKKALLHRQEPSEEKSAVLNMLREQASLYARLEDYARRQRHLVVGEDTSLLLAVLADRQRLSAELAELGTTLAPVRRNWESFRGELSERERGEADRLVAETAACLRRVIESDEQDARLLSARRALTARELQTTHAGGSAIAAYRPMAAAGTARRGFFDEAT